jgi:hypothetical protein
LNVELFGSGSKIRDSISLIMLKRAVMQLLWCHLLSLVFGSFPKRSSVIWNSVK